MNCSLFSYHWNNVYGGSEVQRTINNRAIEVRYPANLILILKINENHKCECLMCKTCHLFCACTFHTVCKGKTNLKNVVIYFLSTGLCRNHTSRMKDIWCAWAACKEEKLTTWCARWSVWPNCHLISLVLRGYRYDQWGERTDFFILFQINFHLDSYLYFD